VDEMKRLGLLLESEDEMDDLRDHRASMPGSVDRPLSLHPIGVSSWQDR
jgi:hypothetical protein